MPLSPLSSLVTSRSSDGDAHYADGEDDEYDGGDDDGDEEDEEREEEEEEAGDDDCDDDATAVGCQSAGKESAKNGSAWYCALGMLFTTLLLLVISMTCWYAGGSRYRGVATVALNPDDTAAQNPK